MAIGERPGGEGAAEPRDERSFRKSLHLSVGAINLALYGWWWILVTSGIGLLLKWGATGEEAFPVGLLALIALFGLIAVFVAYVSLLVGSATLFAAYGDFCRFHRAGLLLRVAAWATWGLVLLGVIYVPLCMGQPGGQAVGIVLFAYPGVIILLSSWVVLVLARIAAVERWHPLRRGGRWPACLYLVALALWMSGGTALGAFGPPFVASGTHPGEVNMWLLTLGLLLLVGSILQYRLHRGFRYGDRSGGELGHLKEVFE